MKKRVWKVVIVIIPILICLLTIVIWFKTEKWISNGQKPVARGENDYAIVLGAKVNNITPSLSLRYRLESALAYANEYPTVILVLSGGQGPDEAITEAEAMKNYLIANGIDEKRLIVEEKSTSTYENVLFSTELMPTTISSFTIITSDYHLARSKNIAKELGFETDVIVAKTPEVVAGKLKTRERLALVKNYLIGK